jgi:hypothetical protein
MAFKGKLEESETTCTKLIEENFELKHEIENLAREVVEVNKLSPLIKHMDFYTNVSTMVF